MFENFDVFEELLKTCKKQGKYYLLAIKNFSEETLNHIHYYIDAEITGGTITVWNDSTKRLSDKSIYKNKRGQFYIKDVGLLEDFK